MMRIDFHLHYINIRGFVENTLKLMDDAQIDKTLLVSLPNVEFEAMGGKLLGGNEEVAQAVKNHPSRFVGCLYVDPREKNAVDIINKYYDQGFRCVKMYPPLGFYLNDLKWDPVFERINQLELPVLIHTGWTRGHTTPDYPVYKGKIRYTDSSFALPLYVDYPARKYSKINFVIAHMGSEFFLQALTLSDFNPNVYLDIAIGTNRWAKGPTMDFIANLYNTLGKGIPIDWNRVVWGTDNIKPPRRSIEDAVKFLEKMGVPDKYHDTIFGDTARLILKLDT